MSETRTTCKHCQPAPDGIKCEIGWTGRKCDECPDYKLDRAFIVCPLVWLICIAVTAYLAFYGN